MFNLYFKAALCRFVKLLPCKKIKLKVNDSIYLERYYLIKSPLINVKIHRILESDADERLHDHPWEWAISVILLGGYVEERLQDDKTVRKKTYGLGRPNIIGANTFHRVSLLLSEEVWTLFIHGPRNKEWTFLNVVNGEQSDKAQ